MGSSLNRFINLDPEYIEKHNDNVASIEGDINGLEDQVGAQDTDIAGLTSRLAAVESTLSSNPSISAILSALNGYDFDAQSAANAAVYDLDLTRGTLTPYFGATAPTHTRAGSATYKSASLQVATAATDVPRFVYDELNLVTYSEDLDNAAWTATAVTVTANQIKAPDGNVSADLILETAATSQHRISQTVASFTAGVTYTISAYFKNYEGASARHGVVYLPTAAFGDNLAVAVDMDTGVTTLEGTGTSVTHSATDKGDDWWRVQLNAEATATASGVVRLMTTNDSADPIKSYAGDTGSGVYAWGVQVEANATASNYEKTLGSTSTARGLLREGSSTNLCLQSEDFSTTWTVANATVNVNVTNAPDGNATADSLVEDGTSGVHRLQQAGIGNVTSGNYVPASVWVKPTGVGSKRYLQILFGGNGFGGTDIIATFDPVTGAISSDGNIVTAYIDRWTNGWIRCVAVAQATATDTMSLRLALADNLQSTSLDSYAGDGASGLYLWGAQVENGQRYATSYIATTVSQVARAGDVDTLALSSVADLYANGEAALSVEFETPPVVASSTVAQIDDGTNTNRHQLRLLDATSIQYATVNGGTEQTVSGSLLDASDTVRAAIGWRDNDYFIADSESANAAQETPDQGVPTVTTLRLGENATGASQFNGVIKRLRLYRRRLTNSEGESVTRAA